MTCYSRLLEPKTAFKEGELVHTLCDGLINQKYITSQNATCPRCYSIMAKVKKLGTKAQKKPNKHYSTRPRSATPYPDDNDYDE